MENYKLAYEGRVTRPDLGNLMIIKIILLIMYTKRHT